MQMMYFLCGLPMILLSLYSWAVRGQHESSSTALPWLVEVSWHIQQRRSNSPSCCHHSPSDSWIARETLRERPWTVLLRRQLSLQASNWMLLEIKSRCTGRWEEYHACKNKKYNQCFLPFPFDWLWLSNPSESEILGDWEFNKLVQPSCQTVMVDCHVSESFAMLCCSERFVYTCWFEQ